MWIKLLSVGLTLSALIFGFGFNWSKVCNVEKTQVELTKKVDATNKTTHENEKGIEVIQNEIKHINTNVSKVQEGVDDIKKLLMQNHM